MTSEMRSVIFRNNQQWSVWKNKVFTDLESIYAEYCHFQNTLPHPAREFGDDMLLTKEDIQTWLSQVNSHALEDVRAIGEDYGDADWYMVAVTVEDK